MQDGKEDLGREASKLMLNIMAYKVSDAVISLDVLMGKSLDMEEIKKTIFCKAANASAWCLCPIVISISGVSVEARTEGARMKSAIYEQITLGIYITHCSFHWRTHRHEPYYVDFLVLLKRELLVVEIS